MIKVIIKRKIKPGKQSDYQNLVATVKQKAQGNKGYISGEFLRSMDNPDDIMVISTWETKAHWDAWNETEERKDFAKMINTILEEDESIEFYLPNSPQ